MGPKNMCGICLYFLFNLLLHLRVAGLQSLKNDGQDSHFNSPTLSHGQEVKEMSRKTSKEFDTITFVLVESDAPLLVTQALGENIKNNLHEWLFSSSKLKRFNTVSSFVHIEKSNTHAQYCPARDDRCQSSTQEALDDDYEASALESQELDDEHQNHCTPVSFPPLWPSPSQSGPGGWVSLWVYFSQYGGAGPGCSAARLPISNSIGENSKLSRLWRTLLIWPHAFTRLEKIEVPELMRDFDLAFLDWQTSYLLYLYAFTTFEASSTSPPEKACALCVLEGSGTALVRPPNEGGPSLSDQQQMADAKSFSTSFEEFDCILVPKFWKLEMQSSTPTSLLLLTWEDEVTLTQEFVDRIVAEEGSSSPRDKGPQPSVAVALSHYMPPAERTSPTVWLDQPKLPYIFSRFLFPKLLEIDLDEFVDLLKVDANVFPSLVDCPPKSECLYLLRQIFTELDFNSDGYLNESDLPFLTPAKYEHLSNELDDLIQEVIDVATDQWEEALEARTSTKASQWVDFANRAQEKRLLTATKTAQRIARGDLSVDEIATIRENLPGLYEELIEYGNIEPLE